MFDAYLLDQQLELFFNDVSWSMLVLLSVSTLVLSATGFALLVVGGGRALKRQPSGLIYLSVVAVELLLYFGMPLLSYFTMMHFAARFGMDAMALVLLSWSWCPVSFGLVLLALINVALLVQSRRLDAA